MNAGELFVLVLFAAIFVQWVTERVFGQWLHKLVPQLKGEFMVLVATLVGILFALFAGLEALGAVGFAMNPWADRVITGIIIGGGSSAVHDLLGKYLKR